MKVTFHKGIKSKSGRYKDFDIVYSTYKVAKGNKICIARRYVLQRYTIHNKLTGSKTKAIARLWNILSPDFKEDCSKYALIYNKKHHDKHNQELSGYNIFFKAVSKLETSNITFDKIRSLYGVNLNEWIQKCILPVLSKLTPYLSMFARVGKRGRKPRKTL